MAKKQTKSIFDMELDEFKSNFDKKYGNPDSLPYRNMQNWTIIGMLLKLGKKILAEPEAATEPPTET